MSASPKPKDSFNDRIIRVFISSTFRDMMRERDLLVKEVFPELRCKCANRFVTFTEVGLRFRFRQAYDGRGGITESQANEGLTLPLCLAEIERSLSSTATMNSPRPRNHLKLIHTTTLRPWKGQNCLVS